MIKDHDSIDVFIGVDVGKSDHHAVALNRAGKKLWEPAMPLGLPWRVTMSSQVVSARNMEGSHRSQYSIEGVTSISRITGTTTQIRFANDI